MSFSLHYSIVVETFSSTVALFSQKFLVAYPQKLKQCRFTCSHRQVETTFSGVDFQILLHRSC